MTLSSTKFMMRSCLHPDYGFGVALVDNIRNADEIKRNIVQIPAALIRPAVVYLNELFLPIYIYSFHRS